MNEDKKKDSSKEYEETKDESMVYYENPYLTILELLKVNSLTGPSVVVYHNFDCDKRRR